MQEAANGCGTIFLLKLNLLHPKCHTMCALVITSMIGLYSPGNRIGPMQFKELMAVVNVGLLGSLQP
jgi:hypothetical protein